MRTARLLTCFALAAAGCGTPPRAPFAGPSVEDVLASRPRLLWVAAHPDDESMGGPVLARACVLHESACHFVVLNRGTGGECNLQEGCHPTLGDVRHGELVKSSRLYRSALEHYDFFNAPLPVESFPSRQEIQKRWRSEGDPAGIVARAIRRFQPDVVVTLDPYQGFTGHPEHQATARFAIRGAHIAADAASTNEMVKDEAPHRITHLFHVQNKYWFMSVAGDPHDPEPYTDRIDNTVHCVVDREGRERRCVDVVVAHTRVHLSQDRDMGAIRTASKFWGTTYVRQLDPFGAEATALVEELPP